MITINSNLSIIILNINVLKALIKRQRLSKWIKKQNLIIYCLQKICFKYKDTYRLKVNIWRKIYQTNINQKKAGVTILISDRTHIKPRKVIRDLEGHNDKGANSLRRYNNP